MGTLGTLFSTIANRAEQHAQLQRQQAEEGRASYRQIYGAVLANPNADEAQRTYAIKQLKKLNGVTEGDSPYDKLGGFLNTLGRKMQGLPSLDGQQPQAQQPMSSVAGAPAASDVNQPGIASRIVGKGLTALSSGLSNVTKAHNLPPLADIQADMIPAMGMGAPVKTGTKPTMGQDLVGQLDVFGNPIDESAKGKYYISQSYKNGQTRWQPVNPTANLSGRAVPLHPISVTDAKKLAGQGQVFTDLETGSQIDPTQLAPTMQIVPMTLPGGKIGYKVTSQNQTHFNVGNEVYAVPSFEQMNLGQVGVPLGTANPGSVSERVVGVDASNNPIIAPMATSRPVTGLTPLSTPSGARSTTQSTPTAPTTSRRTGLPPISQNQTSVPRGTRSLEGVIPLGQANNLRQRNTALNGTTTALENAIKPDATGKSYLDLFRPENSKTREKVADFIRLNDAIAEGEYSNKAGESDVTSLLHFSAGLPGMVASSKNQSLIDAYNQLRNDPAAVRAVADYYNLIGQIGGMRKATGANASQWSFQNLKQEVPSPLMDSSYEGVMGKMRNLANEVNSNAEPNLKARKFDNSLLSPKNAPKGDMVQVKLKDGRSGSIHRTQLQRFLTDNPGSSEVK